MSSISNKAVKPSSSSSNSNSSSDDCAEVRRGPWTLHEDSLLLDYISIHGEGRWNLLSKRAGLRRTGKSCRLRWLNYLKPDIKRGNLSPLEQLSILHLHSIWGNRWSKIAQQLPGRTDNEIKNYWRTRVQRQAKHLNVDANSTAFKEIIRTLWMPRLLQNIQYASSSSPQQPINVSQLDQLQQYQTFTDVQMNSTSSDRVTNFSNCFEDSYYVDTGSCYNVEIMSGVPQGFGNHVGDGHVADVDCAGFDFGDNMWRMDEFMTF